MTEHNLTKPEIDAPMGPAPAELEITDIVVGDGEGVVVVPAEMAAEIHVDHRRHGAWIDRPRHKMELDFYVYEYDLNKRVLPQGRARARMAATAPAARAPGWRPSSR